MIYSQWESHPDDLRTAFSNFVLTTVSTFCNAGSLLINKTFQKKSSYINQMKWPKEEKNEAADGESARSKAVILQQFRWNGTAQQFPGRVRSSYLWLLTFLPLAVRGPLVYVGLESHLIECWGKCVSKLQPTSRGPSKCCPLLVGCCPSIIITCVVCSPPAGFLQWLWAHRWLVGNRRPCVPRSTAQQRPYLWLSPSKWSLPPQPSWRRTSNRTFTAALTSRYDYTVFLKL